MQNVTRAAEWVCGNHRHGMGSHVIEKNPSLSGLKANADKNNQPWMRVCARVLSAHGNEQNRCFSALKHIMVGERNYLGVQWEVTAAPPEVRELNQFSVT